MNAHCLPLALGLLAALGLSACDRDTANRTEKAANDAGQKIEKALDKTQQKLAEAGEKLKPKLEQAGAEIKPQLERAGNQISAAAEKTGEKLQGAAERTSAKINSPETRETVNDAAITASIKARFLQDPGLSVLKIDVDTSAGVVTLNGLADNDAAKKRAEELARSVNGVKEVRNHLATKKV